jgi:hypothetical protein
MTEAYEPPKVWTWNKESGGRFAAINRPIAGPTHDKELSVGKHPLQLYSLGTPNGVKVAVKRQLDVLDRHLAENTYMAGDDYSIADMAIWPWYGALVKGLVYDAGEFLAVQDYTHVQRWTDMIAERPAVKRGRMVNRVMGDPASQLRERHDASDFETKTQDKIEATS